MQICKVSSPSSSCKETLETLEIKQLQGIYSQSWERLGNGMLTKRGKMHKPNGNVFVLEVRLLLVWRSLR